MASRGREISVNLSNSVRKASLKLEIFSKLYRGRPMAKDHYNTAVVQASV